MNTTDTTDLLVADYLARLARAAARMPSPRRDELLEEIDAHIRSARAAGPADDEAGVRTLLDRLGTPEEIVAAATDDVPPVGLVRRPWAALEVAAFAMLTVGSFLLGIGWLIGVVLLWSSRRWRLREKLLLTLVVPGGPALFPLIGVFLPAQVCTQVEGGPETCTGFAFPEAIGIPLLIVSFFGPFVVGGIMLHRAIARAATEPAIPVRPWWGRREIAAVLMLGVGAVFLPVLAPAVGLALAWTSTCWARRDKIVATGVALVPVAVGAIILALGSGFAAHLMLIIAVVLGPIMAALYLTITLDRSAA
jgi:hypothetical protein